MPELPFRPILFRTFQLFFSVFNVLIWIRIIFSFFRPRPYTFLDRVDRVSWSLTEPILSPIRNLLPRTAMVDFSPMVALILLQIVESILVRILF